MKNDNSLFSNISSSYILRFIFSHIRQNKFISLIKYNKNIQEKLNLNLKEEINYHSDYILKNEINYIPNDNFDGIEGCIFIFAFAIIYIYFFIHYLLNVGYEFKLNNNFEKTFGKGEFITINNYFFKKLYLIFYFFAFIMQLHILLYYYRGDYIQRKIVYSVLMLLVILIHFYYEKLLMFKIKIIFSCALYGKWHIFFDVIYFLLNIINIFFSFYFLSLYYKSEAFQPRIESCKLLTYKDVKILEYELPLNFDSYENKSEYYSSNVKNFEVYYEYNDYQLVDSINNYRETKNLNKLNNNKSIPSFIIEGNTELLLSTSDIIKLSDTKYILKLNVDDDFSKIQNNKNFMDILLKPFFNEINIIRRRNIKYITVFEEFDFHAKNYDVIQLRDNSEGENTLI